MPESLRLDHYLFRARLFKSRSKATNACREGKVLVNGEAAKASSDVRPGDEISIRQKGLYNTVRVEELPGKNLPKDKAKETWEDITPEEVIEQKRLRAAARASAPHDSGAKPSKKERRDLRKLRGY